jgi:hypothetical protein
MSKIAEVEGLLEHSMRDRDPERVGTLRLVLSSLRRDEKDLGRALTEAEELQILQRERKQRVEAAEAFSQAGRDAQAASETAELAIIESLMPDRLSDEELAALVDRKIADTGATSAADFGRVMGELMSEVAGRADGAAVSQLVRERLS